jgi:hypothetical protein
MSETNGEAHVHEIPQETFRLPSGEEFSLPLLDTIYAFEDLDAAIPAMEDLGKRARLYFDKIRQWVGERTGVSLNYAEADWLNSRLNLLYGRKKKGMLDDYDELRTSPSSTESTPSS